MQLRSTHYIGALLLFASFSPLKAEPARSSLDGTVLDSSGQPLQGVKVTATAEAKSLGATAVTSTNGHFSLLLEDGRYSLRIAAVGFRNELRSVDILHSASATSIEIVLQVAEHREMITVHEPVLYQAVAVTATKTPTLLVDTPQAISVVSSEQIRDQSMQNMADVVRYIPGITMAQGEGHRDAPVIRGNVTTADFYVDGIRDDVQYLRDLYNTERVEAVKGANALTFGRGGGGGILNRVTKSATLFPIREFALQGGTFSNRRFTTDIGHTLGDKFAFRLNAMYENSDSFRHDVNLERYGVSPSLVYQVSSHTLVRLRYEYFNDARTTDRGIPSFQGRPSSAHRSTFFGDPTRSYNYAGVHIGSATFEHQRGVWNLRNSTLSGDYDKFYQNIFPGAVDEDQTVVNISGYNSRTNRHNLFNQTDVTAILQTGRFRHTILIGSEFGYQRSNNLRSTAYFNNQATSILVPFSSPNIRVNPAFRQSAADADNRPSAKVAAVFFQDQIELTRHVQLLAGLRYDRFATDFFNNRDSQSLDRDDNLLSPRLGLVVKPAARISLYGSYSVAYLPSSGDQFSSLDATSQTLKPERFNNYEAGMKWDITSRLSFTSALYRLDRLNTRAPDPNVAGRLVQTGSQRTNGFEVSLNGTLTNRWSIAGGFTFQDAFISSRTTAALAGQKVAIVPNNTFSLWNNIRILPRLSAGLGLIRQDAMFASIDNKVALPAFTRVDAGLFYTLTEAIRVQVNAENLFDTTYYSTAHNNNNILPGSALALRIGLVIGF